MNTHETLDALGDRIDQALQTAKEHVEIIDRQWAGLKQKTHDCTQRPGNVFPEDLTRLTNEATEIQSRRNFAVGYYNGLLSAKHILSNETNQEGEADK